LRTLKIQRVVLSESTPIRLNKVRHRLLLARLWRDKVRNCADITQGRVEDALTLYSDEGRGVTAISFGEPSSRL
jgi:hypothetical protein